MASSLVMHQLKHASTAESKHSLFAGRTLASMTYGARLAEALQLAKKDRKALAEELGVSVQALGQTILGKTNAGTAENCAKTARFLRVDMHWLATGEGEPRPKQVLSPMALKIAGDFDSRVPMDRRDAVYAQVMGAIDLASPAQLPTAPLPHAPSAAPAQH